MKPVRAFVHGFSFSGLIEEITAHRPEEVAPALARLEEATAAGAHAAGFVSYEAAPGVDAALPVCEPSPFPLLWFGIFRERYEGGLPHPGGSYRTFGWEASVTPEEYARSVREIRELIAAGECYQVNFTMRQRFSFSGDPLAWFRDMMRLQPTPYGSYLVVGEFTILSASPELFFAVQDGTLTCRPMKGTAPRGRWTEEDEEMKERLRRSPKERAENLMIVDLLRNDMGKVAQTGSVTVTSLFDIESWSTVHQLTSTIEGKVPEGTGIRELFCALFPCGSITGAPKRRSMKIIADLEGVPRALYTGCIGYLSPGGEASFSVAIRTAVIDASTGQGELGIGSGITYDSREDEEHAECLGKARFAQSDVPDFSLIESLLLDGEYFLLERHLARLARSAAFFSFPFDTEEARRALTAHASTLQGSHKVRLLLHRGGGLDCTSAPVADAATDAIAAFASIPVHSRDPLLYHKTTCRPLYDEERARHPEYDELIFVNERGEITEGANSNVVALVDGELLTPPRECGLLPGVLREELLERGEIRERVLTRGDLEKAQAVYIINSVRRWRTVRLAGAERD
ncbi:aminodeoxychorismate synthase component I [Geomonas sp. RF6]|uniref:aminodeoxychorismate synthase component I n=1 Tax=Geomonas sp. RF6 TaxID=2897342 RepID=UPI001E595AA9|nr:aminodeoxychorismate synthase component I [Geomonas sp. RF6]UFS72617.1 aminodeoxychorismate synthase component I [Geomonas sp. RF6]